MLILEGQCHGLLVCEKIVEWFFLEKFISWVEFLIQEYSEAQDIW